MPTWKKWMITGMIGMGFVGVAGMALAAESSSAPAPASKETSSTSTAAPAGQKAVPALDSAPGAAAPATPAVPAPAAAAPMTAAPAAPTLRPIMIKFSGEVVQINKQNAGQPMLTVRDRYGVTKEMSAEAGSIKVSRGTAAAMLDDLKQGDQVSVDYTYDVATGKRHVQAVTIAETPAVPASSAAAPATKAQ